MKNYMSTVGGMAWMMGEVMNIGGVDCYEKEGVAYLNLDAVARGLGFTTTQIINGTEYKNVRWNRVDEYLRELNFATSGKRPDFIPENIFYRLAMKAKNDVAEAFQAKVADEIIPSIRKHGAYLTPETIEAAIVNPDIMIQLCMTIKEERAQKEALQAQALADRPKVQFAEAVEASSGSVKVGDFAKLVSKRNGVQIGQNKLYKWMRDKKILTRDNVPYQRYMKAGYFEVSEFLLRGRPVKMTYITGKGQTYLYKRLRGSELSA